MRFQLPGRSAAVALDVIAEAEGTEDGSLDDEEEEIWEEPLSKKIRITVHDLSEIGAEHPTIGVRPAVEKDTVPVKPERQTEQDAWVNRIMHPWLNGSLCCPEVWDDSTTCGRDKPPPPIVLTQDQSAFGAGSFDSSVNDVSSMTPIMPPFPTSTYDSQYDGDKDDEDADTQDGTGLADKYTTLSASDTGAVLGIMDRNVAIPDDALVGLEEASQTKKRGRESPPPPPPPPRDSWYEGDDHIVSHPKPPSSGKSKWRKKAWIPQEEIDTSPLDDEFDVESYSRYDYRPRSPSRLAEI